LDSAKNYENSVDFQLPFYALVVKEHFKIPTIRAGFYDLYEGRIIEEQDLELKIRTLKKKLLEIEENSKEVEFSLREKKDACRFCDFIYLCDRYKNLK
ncbi:MAG: PD-(D/E)XK nuclease family protein, partial [Helicobacter sp.]|nr:PD-(D/E)XK nuclease family protein [Helicobacter sp.]